MKFFSLRQHDVREYLCMSNISLRILGSSNKKDEEFMKILLRFQIIILRKISLSSMTFSYSIHRTFPHRDWEKKPPVRLLMARFFYTSAWESNSSEPHVTVQQVYFVTEVIRLNKKCQVKKTVRVWSFSLVIVSRVRLCVVTFHVQL